MPFPLPPPDQAPPPVILAVAAREYCPPLLMAAIAWRESEWTERHITPADGGSGFPSVGYLQVNLGTVRAMSGYPALRALSVEQLKDGATNTTVGCRIFRYHLRRILRGKGYPVQHYEDVPHVLAGLSPGTRRKVLEHSVACYTVGDAAVYAWPRLAQFLGAEKAAVKTQYVADVMRIYGALREGAKESE